MFLYCDQYTGNISEKCSLYNPELLKNMKGLQDSDRESILNESEDEGNCSDTIHSCSTVSKEGLMESNDEVIKCG